MVPKIVDVRQGKNWSILYRPHWGMSPNLGSPYTVTFVLERFRKLERHMAKLMSKSELIQKIADERSNALTRKDIKGVIESLASIGYKELKKTGAFFVPGFAKFVVIKKPATKARKGINPFTKEPTIFKAKPARKIIRARPVKAVKDAVA
jgi:DNA-binding protein HU-beta